MKRGWFAIIVFLILAAAGIVISIATRDREPRYGGKPLSEWLKLTASNGQSGLSKDSVEAIAHIGTNAVPYLLESIQYQQPTWETALADKFHVRYFMTLEGRTYLRRAEAVAAFKVLGGQAKGAIPELSKLMSSKVESISRMSSGAMGAIGKDSIPVLLDFLTNRPAHTLFAPFNLVFAWNALGTNATNTIPFLIEHLNDRDFEVAETCIGLLATLAANDMGSATILSDVCTNFDALRTEVRLSIVLTLGPIAEARGSPLLQNALLDLNQAVQRAARDAMKNFRLQQPSAERSASNEVSNATH